MNAQILERLLEPIELRPALQKRKQSKYSGSFRTFSMPITRGQKGLAGNLKIMKKAAKEQQIFYCMEL